MDKFGSIFGINVIATWTRVIATWIRVIATWTKVDRGGGSFDRRSNNSINPWTRLNIL